MQGLLNRLVPNTVYELLHDGGRSGQSEMGLAMVRLREMFGSAATNPGNGPTVAVVDKSDSPTVTQVNSPGEKEPSPSKIARAAETAEEEVRRLTGEMDRLRAETDAVLTAAEQARTELTERHDAEVAELRVELDRALGRPDERHEAELQQLRTEAHTLATPLAAALETAAHADETAGSASGTSDAAIELRVSKAVAEAKAEAGLRLSREIQRVHAITEDRLAAAVESGRTAAAERHAAQLAEAEARTERLCQQAASKTWAAAEAEIARARTEHEKRQADELAWARAEMERKVAAATQCGRADAAEQHATQIVEIETRAERVRLEAEAEGRAIAEAELAHKIEQVRAEQADKMQQLRTELTEQACQLVAAEERVTSDVERARSEADQRLADEINRVQADTEDRMTRASDHLLTTQLAAARQESEKQQATAAREAHEAAEATAARTLAAELHRASKEADRRLDQELRRVQAVTEDRLASAIEAGRTEAVKQHTEELAKVRAEAEQRTKDAVTTVRAELEAELLRATGGRDKEHEEQLRQLREAVDGLFVELTPEG